MPHRPMLPWHSSSAKNATASLVAFASSSLSGLVSIPVAVAYLGKDQIGLWTLVTALVSYLLWLDLGIGNATGRKIAPAIANHDSCEINRWWTLSVTALALLGAAMLALSFGMSFILTTLLAVPVQQSKDAVSLFLGVASVTAAGMALRAYPGILLAMNRFHWVSISQALSSWIQFPLFWWLLHNGHGIRSYFLAFLTSSLCGWALFVWKVHRGLPNLRLDFSGLQSQRLRDLLTFSGSLAVRGLSDAILVSVPAIILARFGGLHMIPIYNLTQRGPVILANLCNRLIHAFYPDLQQSHISGEITKFSHKYQSVGVLGIWLSLTAAGGIITFNRSLTCWLANEGFYAGHWTNLLFACSVLVSSFAGFSVHLLQISGDMGKIALISIIEIPITLALSYVGYSTAGTVGIAAVCLLVPLFVRIPYCIRRGCMNCESTPRTLLGKSPLKLATCLLAVLGAGISMSLCHEDGAKITLFGRDTFAPHIVELCIGIPLTIASIWMVRVQLHKIQNEARICQIKV